MSNRDEPSCPTPKHWSNGTRVAAHDVGSDEGCARKSIPQVTAVLDAKELDEFMGQDVAQLALDLGDRLVREWDLNAGPNTRIPEARNDLVEARRHLHLSFESTAAVSAFVEPRHSPVSGSSTAHGW